MWNNILVSTTQELPGYQIKEYKSVIFERVVAGVGFITEFFASFSDVLGGRSGRMEDQMDSLYSNLLTQIKNRAEKLQANAIIGFSVDIDEISGRGTQMLMISGTGTAVVVEPLPQYSTEKSQPWLCSSCKTYNLITAKFCPQCGERRHYNWKCQNCGEENAASHLFCPSCGKQQTRNEEHLPFEVLIEESSTSIPDTNCLDAKTILNVVSELQSVREIQEYIRRCIDGRVDPSSIALLQKLSDAVSYERMYGHGVGKQDAINAIKIYLGHVSQTIETVHDETVVNGRRRRGMNGTSYPEEK